ncbi:MAG TPA: M48 family metalloprotease [Bryobacterales bacterium]|nr:M48 family metalloprotease [Bryobacterales bacterium]
MAAMKCAGLRLWVLVLAAPVLTAQQAPLTRGVNFYSQEKEAALGAALSQDIAQRTTPIGSVAVRDYVERQGSQLAAQLPDAAFPYKFAIIADNEGGSTHEPLSLPGGYFFVPADLILAARNDAEFAGMLAHAMAHVAERHGARLATRGEMVHAGEIPLIYMSGVSDTGEDGLAIPAGFLQRQRAFELEADRLAASVLASAGYDPRALVRYIGRVQPENSGRPEAFSSLPSRATRLAGLEQAIQALGTLPAVSDSATSNFQLVQQELRRLAPNAVRRPPSLRRPNDPQ